MSDGLDADSDQEQDSTPLEQLEQQVPPFQQRARSHGDKDSGSVAADRVADRGEQCDVPTVAQCPADDEEDRGARDGDDHHTGHDQCAELGKIEKLSHGWRCYLARPPGPPSPVSRRR